MWNRELLKLDTSDMLGKIAGLPAQLRDGFRLAEDAWEPFAGLMPSAIAVAGMGGSAIGGEVLRTYLSADLRVPVVICRDYDLPGFITGDSLVIVSSYSGNTEEALWCFRDALVRGATVGCVGSGGELLAEAAKHSVPYVRLPAGFPPRAALGYSFSALLGLVWCAGMCEPKVGELEDCVELLRTLTGSYASPEAGSNEAIRIAEGLGDSCPIVYCSGPLAAVGLRWKNQFCENAKRHAFVGILPEMSHNDIMGWEGDDRSVNAGVVLLRMDDEHPRIAARFSFLKEVLDGKTHYCGEFRARGSSLLTRMFSLILLGDYVSVYLALLCGIDPTPIGTIDRLKSWIRDSQSEE
jgi:glucose/mannose-6-phosphate isomerase